MVELNGLRVSFSGDLPTLIVQNRDRPGCVGEVATLLAREDVNIATLQLYRDYPGGNAVMIVETDRAVPRSGLAAIGGMEDIRSVTFLDTEEGRHGH